ncbi:hypothetical protein D3C73_1578210 [compost metagenome]
MFCLIQNEIIGQRLLTDDLHLKSFVTMKHMTVGDKVGSLIKDKFSLPSGDK